MIWMLCSLFWVIPRQNTLCSIFIGVVSRGNSSRLQRVRKWNRQSVLNFLLKTRMKMERTECSEMSAHKIKMQGNHPKERKQTVMTSLVPTISCCWSSKWQISVFLTWHCTRYAVKLILSLFFGLSVFSKLLVEVFHFDGFHSPVTVS